MNYLSLLALVACVASLASAQYTKAPNCSIDEFEHSFTKAYGYFGITNLKLPGTVAALDQYCKNIANNKVYSKSYSERCLTGTSQTLLNLQVYNVDRVNKPYCSKKGKKRDEYISWSSCGNAAKPETKKCWDKMVNEIANSRKVTNTKSRIPCVCCSYYAWIKCNAHAWEKTKPACGQNAIDGYKDVLHRSTVDSMNLICSRYEDDEAKCAKYFAEMPNKKNKKLRPTPISYIFDVFESI